MALLYWNYMQTRLLLNTVSMFYIERSGKQAEHLSTLKHCVLSFAFQFCLLDPPLIIRPTANMVIHLKNQHMENTHFVQRSLRSGEQNCISVLEKFANQIVAKYLEKCSLHLLFPTPFLSACMCMHICTHIHIAHTYICIKSSLFGAVWKAFRQCHFLLSEQWTGVLGVGHRTGNLE